MSAQTRKRLAREGEPAPGGSGRGAGVLVADLVKVFRREDGSIIKPVKNISLEVAAGEMVVLLGPSGCGKTTLLRCIAGLEYADSGGIWVRGECVHDPQARISVPAERRGVSMVFQSYALWPHMTVFANVAYPLRVRRVPKAEIEQRVLRVLETVGIEHLRRQYPAQLSGGQQQRVALARAIVPNNVAVLFDEPLSNVDAKVRAQLRQDIFETQRAIGFAGIYVTHDQEEALEIADRIVVLEGGEIAQSGTPEEIYKRPASRYVAHFVGTVNEAKGTVRSVDAHHIEAETEFGLVVARKDRPLSPGERVRVVWRPEASRLIDELEGGPNRWKAVLRASVTNGPLTKTTLDLSGTAVQCWSATRPRRATDVVTVHPDDVLLYPEPGE